MRELSLAYAETRDRFIEMLRALPEAELSTAVPATPAWSVKDVVAHLTGVCRAYVEDDPPRDPEPEADPLTRIANWNQSERAAARNEWTQAMVDSRAEADLEAVIGEWDDLSARAATLMENDEMTEVYQRGLVTDLALHTHDVRAAVGRAADRDLDAVDVAFWTLYMMLSVRVGAGGLAPLAVVTDGGEHATGEGEPGATLSGSTFEIVRALGGRRSEAQLRKMLDGDTEAYLAVVPLYPPPVSPLIE